MSQRSFFKKKTNIIGAVLIVILAALVVCIGICLYKWKKVHLFWQSDVLHNQITAIVENTYFQDKVEGIQQNINIQSALKDTLSDLVSKYGVFDTNQHGVMSDANDKWFHPQGIMSATILDFDSDNVVEMLVCRTQRKENLRTDSQEYLIVMDMYEFSDGKVVLADSMPFSADEDEIMQNVENPKMEEGVQLYFIESEFIEISLDISTVWTDKGCYIMCEAFEFANTFGDGVSRDYWMLHYIDGKMRYVNYLKQSPASTDFRYVGYKFEDGRYVDSNVYYSEWIEDTPLFDDVNVAVAEFFRPYNIKLNSPVSLGMGSILSSDNKMKKILSFTNKKVSPNRYVYGFIATLNVDEESVVGQKQSENENTVQADNTYLEVYENILSNTYFTKYAYYDIDKDQIPELFLSNGDGGHCDVQIYTYQDGELLDLGTYIFQYRIYEYEGNGVLFTYGGTGTAMNSRFYINNVFLYEDETVFLGCNVHPGVAYEEYTYKGENISQTEYEKIKSQLVPIDFYDIDKKAG